MEPLGDPAQATGNYLLGRLLGKGGMGSVFAATHRFLGTRVAIKLLHPQLAESPEISQRFFREARAAVEIDHPNVVRVTDFGQTNEGTLYLVMELLTGRSLARVVATHQFAEAEVARLGAEIAAGVEAAHARGIIHRDLKPDNIFLTTTQVKILDFGIAKVFDSLVTTTGGALGTPLYMDPEQAKDASSCGPASDIYSLGIILFEMLTGRPPFVGDNLPAVLTKHLFAPPPRPSEIVPVSAPMEELVLGCLAKDPQARPHSMNDVRHALEQLADGLDCAAVLGRLVVNHESAYASTLPSPAPGMRPRSDAPPTSSASTPPAPSALRRSARVRRRTWTIGGWLLFAAVAGGFGWQLGQHRGREPSADPGPAVVAPVADAAPPRAEDAGLPATAPPPVETILVRSRPEGALVIMAGVGVGTTPLSLSVPLPAEIWVSLDGYEDLRHVVTQVGAVDLMLQRRSRRPREAAPRERGTPAEPPGDPPRRFEGLD